MTGLIKTFGQDERGVFAVIFGVVAIVLVAFSGSVVDFVKIQKVRSVAQRSMDMTALTLQSSIYSQTSDEISASATALILAQMELLDVDVVLETVIIDVDEGKLFLESRIDIPLDFLGLVGITNIYSRVSSQVVRQQSFLEVALVLDNSGSMNSSSRMSHLKTAASEAVDILFGDVVSSPTVSMGVVPFTSFVNIGASNSSASWLDVFGNSSIANDNFDDDDNDSTIFNGPVNRLQLYNQMSNVAWGGCVDARPHTQTTGLTAHLDTDDTLPELFDADTLFVPSFSPDTIDDWSSWRSDYKSDSSGSCGSTSGLSNRERQERLCKYSGNISTDSWGPNFDCPASQLLPLINHKQTVLSSIDSMIASGATNIHMGAIWGFRVLSPTEPFVEGRDYDPDTAKVIIVMTDGQNTMYPSGNFNGASYYSPYGFPYNGRIGAVGWSQSQLISEMNARTIETCVNTKSRGIDIYTIGLSPPNQATRDMLEQCASSPSYAYFPDDPQDLIDVFTEIASQLSALRVSQ